MLRRLSLRDVAIVTALEVEFGAGFTVLTGETGAGKSILIDALQLVLGARGDTAVVREGTPRAEVSAEFDALPAAARAWLDDAGFDATEPLLLRRVVDAQGKSRAWIAGSAATVAQLKTLSEWLVDIHGQHAWQSLARPAAVRHLLDDHAGLDTSALSAAWTAWRQVQATLDTARAQATSLAQERERLAWQLAEIDKLAPGDEEWDELNAEHQRLAHGQAILDGVQAAVEALSEADDSAVTQADRAIAALEGVASYDAALGEALQVLRDAQAQLADAAHTLQAALRHTGLDPARLAELDARLSAWVGLARRWRRPPQDLPATAAAWRAELAALDAAADLDALQRAVDTAHGRYLQEAQRVSIARRRAAPKLARSVSAAMQTLGMAGGRFDIALQPLEQPQAHGLEAVEFLVAGHAGSTPRPMGKVASGGELSRIALAVAATTSQLGVAGTLIFDEVDAGVGGAVADTVGRLMQHLGQLRQVLAVTHLPQVAACATAQWVVSKSGSAAHGVQSNIGAVTGNAREAEIARMLSGEPSSTSLAHAREMLARGAGGAADAQGAHGAQDTQGAHGAQDSPRTITQAANEPRSSPTKTGVQR